MTLHRLCPEANQTRGDYTTFDPGGHNGKVRRGGWEIHGFRKDRNRQRIAGEKRESYPRPRGQFAAGRDP